MTYTTVDLETVDRDCCFIVVVLTNSTVVLLKHETAIRKIREIKALICRTLVCKYRQLQIKDTDFEVLKLRLSTKKKSERWQ